MKQFETKARERYGDPEGTIEKSFGLFLGLDDKPLLQYRTRTKKLDGTFSKNRRSIAVVPNYCPFCGEKYDQVPSEATVATGKKVSAEIDFRNGGLPIHEEVSR